MGVAGPAITNAPKAIGEDGYEKRAFHRVLLRLRQRSYATADFVDGRFPRPLRIRHGFFDDAVAIKSDPGGDRGDTGDHQRPVLRDVLARATVDLVDRLLNLRPLQQRLDGPHRQRRHDLLEDV